MWTRKIDQSAIGTRLAKLASRGNGSIVSQVCDIYLSDLQQRQSSNIGAKLLLARLWLLACFGCYSAMREKFFEVFALAYMIGWLLSRIPKTK